jgi:NADH:ubiquinone oxidoreductase subunit 2 (subunit N)
MNDITRLNFEDSLLILFIILSLLNILGNQNEKNYIKTNNTIYKHNANDIFKFTIIVTIIIYSYYFIRNYNSYTKAKEKNKHIFIIKLLGTSFLIAGAVCLLYFQSKESSFSGSPAL